MREDYWERERMANSSRRKSLEALDYIEIPFESLPMDTLADAPEIQDFHARLHDLSHKKIVNFTGYSNTDLKLAYGAPNINLLSEYDQNFTDLVTLLQSWAAFLLYGTTSLSEDTENVPVEKGTEEERRTAAKMILEYAVSIGSDISASYEILKKLYLETEDTAKIEDIKAKAQTLRSLSKGRILSMLEETGSE